MKIKMFLCLTFLPLFLTAFVGCGSRGGAEEENSELIRLTDLNLQLEAQKESATAKEYPNICFDEDFVLTVPDVDKMYDLKLTKTVLSPAESFARFDSLFDQLFSDVYGEEDKKGLYHFQPKGEANQGLRDDSKPYPNNYPLFYDYRDKLLSGEIEFYEFCADIDKAYLEMFSNGYVHGFSLGKARALYDPVDPGKNIGFWSPEWDMETVGVYNDVFSDISYRLRDKETTIKEAAETAKYLMSEGGYGGGSRLQPKVAQVRAIDLEDGNYGYSIFFAPSYKDVKLLVNVGGGSVGYGGNPHGRDYSQMAGTAFMLESSELDSIVGYNSAFDVEETAEYYSVISFENAVQLLSDSFASNMELHIKSAELMYAKYSVDDDEEEYKTDIIWCFLTENTVNDKKYDIYINALDGKCSYLDH